MYLEYYGLSDFPFQLTPDPRFFFESSVHRKAMAHLQFGLGQGEGFIVITGEVGAGKTTLLGRHLASLDTESFVAAKIVSSHLGGDDMLRSVAAAFGLPLDHVNKASLLHQIEEFLISNYERGRRAILMIDEAQNVTPQALEELRMLSNFQVGNRVPLQSVLLGQPQFRRILARPDLEQFRQRVVASYHLGSLRADETREYIRHRLAVVNWSGRPEIAEEAFPDIFAQTAGVPRKINSFCSRIMLFCYLDELSRIDRDVVKAVAEDLGQETGAVLDVPDHSRSAGVMHVSDPLADFDEANVASLARKVTTLERRVDKHNRALHYLVSLRESALKGEDAD